MPKEQEGIPLTAIHIDLKDRSITFEAEDQMATRLTFFPEGIFYQLLGSRSITQRSVDKLITQSAEPLPPSGSREKEPTVTVTGRLKTEPKPGKPDRSGNPTAYARLAVHEEGRADAYLYLATFHRHTTAIALSLPKDAQITVQGYPHFNDNPSTKRLDTFSVINMPHYPGKPVKGAEGKS